ncbi:hypothetical protein [Pseudomonas sp. 18175]|uniref:hypothetical protein n=1 Tax=Pseudomonas sp. 18175 TaxID=3390056 RepID=UPI003D1D0F4A
MSSPVIQPTQHVPHITPPPSTTQTPDSASGTQNIQPQVLSTQSPAAANVETRQALLNALSAAAKDSSDKLVDLKQTQFAVRTNSSLGRELGQTETTWRSLDWLINRNGWIMPTQASDLQNLHDAIAFAPPPQPQDRDFWGLLSRDIPLTSDLRSQVIQGVGAWVDKTKGGLLDNLEGISLDDTNVQEALKKPKQTSTTRGPLKTQDRLGFKYTSQDVVKTDITPPFTRTSTCLETSSTPSNPASRDYSSHTSQRCSSTLAVAPRHMLEHLLAQPKAIQLGKKLEAQLGVLPTSTSARELVMAALVLNLDPQAGNPRNTISGFALDHPDNFGKSPETIMKALDDHLISNASVKDSHARAMSYLMLSRVAPQFLVKDLPDSLAYGSHQWVTFSSAVARIEHIAPGSSATMTFKHVMDFAGTDPITEHDSANALIARRDALLDWAVTSGELTKRADGNYTKFEIQRAQRDFQEQPSSLVRASKQLSEPLRDRRQVALDDLKRVYGDGIDFERKVLQSTPANTEYDKNHFYSLLDAHMTGKLKAGLWRSISSNFPMGPIEKQFSQLNIVQFEFKNEFDFYYNSLRQGTNTLVRELLSKLPAQDRHSLQHGTQTFYTVGKAVTSAPTHALSKAEIDASQGKHGFIIRSEHASKITYYEVFPYKGEIQIRTDLPDKLTSHTTHGGMALYQANARQAFDWQAYNSDDAPRSGEFSEVRVREIMPRFVWQRLPSDTSADLSFIGNKNKALADFAVTQFLLPDKERLWEQANGESGLEQTHRYQRAGADAALGLIPFATTLKHAINGDALQAINSFIIDGALTFLPGSQGFRAFGHNLTNATKLFNILRKASRSTDDLVGLMASGKAAKSFYSTIPTFTSGSARIAAKNTAQGVGAGALLKTATNDMATGTVKLLGDTGEATSVLAKFDGVDKWYAVDSVSGQAYGVALPNFRSDSAIGLQREVFADGTEALLLDRPLSDNAYALPRSKGYDIVDGEKVYRFNPDKPDQLTDLESAGHAKTLDDFEAICPAPTTGARAKRGANDECYAKIVSPLADSSELQALEHKRLFPSKPSSADGDQFVVYERRLHKVLQTDAGNRLVPTGNIDRIVYNDQIPATVQKAPGFGFIKGVPTGTLEEESMVFKLDRISDASNDQRELRALLIDQQTPGGSTKFLVLEADTAEFYYARLDDIRAGKATFKKCTTRERVLVDGYRNKFAGFQRAAKKQIEAPFVLLPKLQDAFRDLEAAGYSKTQIQALRKSCSSLGPEQKREIVFALQQKGAIKQIPVALKPYQASALDTPAGFTNRSVEQQNKFYAEQAKISVDHSLNATGLGAGNKLLSPQDALRSDAASIVIRWLRQSALGDADRVVKTGAGNCYEMSLLAKDIIRKSGGRAYHWNASGEHAFTVVGGPSRAPAATIDFSEPHWADAWIVDPWADIACPANEYIKQLQEKMVKWESEGVKIDGATSPLHEDWIDALIKQPKSPFDHTYPRPTA